MTNSISMCPNAGLLWEHHYDIYVTYFEFLITHCATVSDCVQCHYWTNQSMSNNAFLAICPVWCNDNTQKKCNGFLTAFYRTFHSEFSPIPNFSILNNIIRIENDNIKHCLQWAWNRLLPISFSKAFYLWWTHFIMELINLYSIVQFTWVRYLMMRLFQVQLTLDFQLTLKVRMQIPMPIRNWHAHSIHLSQIQRGRQIEWEVWWQKLSHVGLTRACLLLVRPAADMLWSVKLKLWSLSLQLSI